MIWSARSHDIANYPGTSPEHCMSRLVVATIAILALFLPEFSRIATAKPLYIRIAPVVAFAPVFVVNETALAFENVAIGQGNPWCCAGKEAASFHAFRGVTCAVGVVE